MYTPRRTSSPERNEPERSLLLMPGQWRPHDAFEHILWIRPPWEWADYLWLDLPEAIFSGDELLFLSHRSYHFTPRYLDLPRIDWRTIPCGFAVERVLPNGVGFAVSARVRGRNAVDLTFSVSNGSQTSLEGVISQACLFLRASKEFSEFTNTNKYVHAAGRGWVSLAAALEAPSDSSPKSEYRVGWRGGPAMLDLPVIAARSSTSGRLVAMTWHEHTYSVIGNPGHPCLHADPWFGTLRSGESRTVRGEIVFFDGDLDAVEAYMESKLI